MSIVTYTPPSPMSEEELRLIETLRAKDSASRTARSCHYERLFNAVDRLRAPICYEDKEYTIEITYSDKHENKVSQVVVKVEND